MNRDKLKRRSEVCRWAVAFVTCLGATVALALLAQAAPVFVDHSLAGVVARLALCSFCLAFFVAADRGIRRAHIDCDPVRSNELFRQIPTN